MNYPVIEEIEILDDEEGSLNNPEEIDQSTPAIKC